MKVFENARYRTLIEDFKRMDIFTSLYRVTYSKTKRELLFFLKLHPKVVSYKSITTVSWRPLLITQKWDEMELLIGEILCRRNFDHSPKNKVVDIVLYYAIVQSSFCTRIKNPVKLNVRNERVHKCICRIIDASMCT